MAGVHGANDIVTDGLVYCVDFANPRSYTPSSNDIYDIISEDKNPPYHVVSSLYDSSCLGHINSNGGFHFKTPMISQIKSICMMLRTGTSSATSWNYLMDIRPYIGNSWYTSQNGSSGRGSAWNYIRINSISSPVSWTAIPLNTWFQFYTETNVAAASGIITFLARYTDAERLNARISHILVYNRNLTEAEVSKNFNALRKRYGI